MVTKSVNRTPRVCSLRSTGSRSGANSTPNKLNGLSNL